MPVDRDLCPLDLKNFFVHSVDGDFIDVVYCRRDHYNMCKVIMLIIMPCANHPKGLVPSSHGKTMKGL